MIQSSELVRREFAAKDDILAALALARRLTGGERASLMLPVPAAPELQVVAALGMADDRLIDTRVRLGAPVAGMVADTGHSLLINDEQEFATIVGRQPLGDRSAAFISVPVPLATAGRGVLSITDPVGRAHFQVDDLSAIEGLAAMIGQLNTLRTQLVQERDRTLAAQKELLWLQESERHRLARDLHDEAGHAVTIAIFQIDLERIKAADPATKATLTRARDAVLSCATALNDMAFRLRPRILEDLGLVSALRVLTTQIDESSKTSVSMELNGDVRPLSAEAELVAFRVVQEGLTNVRKHAQAAHAWVALNFTEATLTIDVRDDGVGTTANEAMGNLHSSQGLRGMRERVEMLGGDLEFTCSTEHMTRLSVRLPLG
ncbi:MAG TPA: sensor histidine kinase [Thermomicrobiales bacterium]|jgi:two-component system sensor histidine kinase UhpB